MLGLEVESARVEVLGASHVVFVQLEVLAVAGERVRVVRVETQRVLVHPGRFFVLALAQQ